MPHHVPPFGGELVQATLLHLEACVACRIEWYRAGRLIGGCTDQLLGSEVSVRLGTDAVAPALDEHMQLCLACRLRRLGFDSLASAEVEVSIALMERAFEAVRR